MNVLEREALAALFAGQIDGMSRGVGFKSMDVTAARDMDGGLIMGVTVDGVRTNHVISAEYMELSYEYMELSYQLASAVSAGQEPDQALLDKLKGLVEQGEFKDYG